MNQKGKRMEMKDGIAIFYNLGTKHSKKEEDYLGTEKF